MGAGSVPLAVAAGSAGGCPSGPEGVEPRRTTPTVPVAPPEAPEADVAPVPFPPVALPLPAEAAAPFELLPAPAVSAVPELAPGRLFLSASLTAATTTVALV